MISLTSKFIIMKGIKVALGLLIASVGGAVDSSACTRVVYLGDSISNMVMVGRTLDWRTPIPTNLYVYPAGVQKQSMPSGPMLKWTSKYGSVVAVGYDGGVTEGMNEMGLAMNGLFCKGTIYKEAVGGDKNMPVMSLSMLVSYFLDNFATVGEVDQWLSANQFAIFGKTFDGGTVSTLHWALTDRSGDTLVMEYVAGELTVHHSRNYQVLTNDPPLPQMEAIEKYWEQIGGVNMLPGTVRSTDRFVRASFFIKHVPTDVKYDAALAALSSIMGTVSVPYGYEIEGEPNVSSTQWRSIADITGGKYYMKFAYSTADFWIDLNSLLLTPGSPILKLDTSHAEGLAGCVNRDLKVSKGFTPMW